MKPSYWTGKRDQVSDEIRFDKVKSEEFGFEKDPSDTNATISIQNITKVGVYF